MWARPVIRPAADSALAVLDVPAIGQETGAHPRSAFEIGHEPVVVIRRILKVSGISYEGPWVEARWQSSAETVVGSLRPASAAPLKETLNGTPLYNSRPNCGTLSYP